MLSDRHIAMMRDFNPWWEGGKPAVPEYQRHVFAQVEKFMKTKQAIAIVGLRRVGKTVLMRQIIGELLENGTPRENVLYFLFDDLVTQKPDVLEDVLDYYLKTTAKDGRKYIFLDEIQKVPFWQEIVKRHYDTSDGLKFVVSGSASLNIKKSKESLAGRLYDLHVPVLSFREFLELNDAPIGQATLEPAGLKQTYEKNIHKKAFLSSMLRKYLEKGAFPEIAKEEDTEILSAYVRSSVIEKIVYEDIPTVFRVNRKDVLYSILEYCARETSGLLEINSLTSMLNVNYRTVRTYLFYLEHSFVLDLLYNYSKSAAKELRKSKKVHIAHPCITMALLRYPAAILDSEIAGKYVETVVFQHVRQMSGKVSFWRSPQKDEVDIVAELDGRLVPVEVKFQASAGESDARSLVRFMQRHGSESGILVTKDYFGELKTGGKTVRFIPAWLFLLAV